MQSSSKAFADLTADDLVATRVWRHKSEDLLLPEEDESWVEPVTDLPVTDAFDHYFAASARLANGMREVVLIGKTEPANIALSEKNQWFVFFRGVRTHLWTNDPPWYTPEDADPHALSELTRERHGKASRGTVRRGTVATARFVAAVDSNEGARTRCREERRYLRPSSALRSLSDLR